MTSLDEGISFINSQRERAFLFMSAVAPRRKPLNLQTLDFAAAVAAAAAAVDYNPESHLRWAMNPTCASRPLEPLLEPKWPRFEPKL